MTDPEPHNLTDLLPDDDAPNVWYGLCSCGEQLQGTTMLRAVKAWLAHRPQ